MFTGIIEQLAEVVALKKEGDNLHISLTSASEELLKLLLTAVDSVKRTAQFD